MEHTEHTDFADWHAAIPVVTADGLTLAFSPFAEGPHRWFATTPTVLVAAPSEGDARGLFALTRGNA